MKYCPNTECRYAVRHHEPQEYRDEAVACTDCGAALATERPAGPVVAAPRDLPYLKLALTLLGPLAVVWLTPKVLLPRIDWDDSEGRWAGFIETEAVNLSVFALGLNPVMAAFLLVELAALVVPRWRPLRTGGPAGRGRLLVASGWASLLLASVQAMGVAGFLERVGLLLPDRRLSRLLVFLSLIAGTAALAAITRVLDRVALGGGFSLLATAFGVAFVWPFLHPIGEELLNGGGGVRDHGILLAGGLVLLGGAASVFLLKWRPATPVRLPACGLVPLYWLWAAVILRHLGVWPETLNTIIHWGEAAQIAVHLTLTAGFAVLLGFLFNPPSKVADYASDARRHVRRAVAFSAAYVVGLALLGELIGRQIENLAFSLVAVAMAVAALLDVIAEADAIRHHGDLVVVWPEHRLYAIDGALEALARNGIPGLARSAHVRALWHFFAPFIPIQIMVPGAQAEEATRVLHAYAARGDVFD